MEKSPICNNDTTILQSIDCQNEFNLIELSLDGHRHIFTKPSEVRQHISNTYDVLRSIYYHTDQIKDYYCKNNSSISGYRGEVFAPYFIMRTSPELCLTEAIKASRDFIDYLSAAYEVEPECLRLIFDGISSIYIVFPQEIFGGFKGISSLPTVHSLIKSRLAAGNFRDNFDYKTYYSTELMPALNTKRKVTGLFAVEISYEELFTSTADELELIASMPRKSAAHIEQAELMEIAELKEIKNSCQTILEESKRYLEIAFRGLSGLINIRPLGSDEDLYFKQKFFYDINSAVAYAQSLNGLTNLYFGIATRKDWTDGTKDNCHMLGVIYADVDYGKEGHKKETFFKTEEEAVNALRSCRLKPTAIMKSGHGFQALWRLKEPVEITAENTFQLEDLIGDLNGYLHGDNVQNLDRIFRVPLTMNIKAKPGILSQIVEIRGENVYTLDDLRSWLDEDYRANLPEKKKAPSKSIYYNSQKTRGHIADRLPIEKYELVYNNCRWLKNVYEKAYSKNHLIHDERFRLASLLIYFEGGEEEALDVISQCSDFRKGFTKYQLKQISSYGYSSPCCERLCGCEKCELVYKLGIYKPIELADLDKEEEAENGN